MVQKPNTEFQAKQARLIHSIPKLSFGKRLKKDLKKNWVVYVIFLPVLLYVLLFNYAPLFGLVMAFQDFNVLKGVFGSSFNNFANFKTLFFRDNFGIVLRNTAGMALLNLTVGFIVPVIFALLLSTIRHKRYKRVIQISSYIPYFISTVVVVALWKEFLDEGGVIANFLSWFGFRNQNWLANNKVPVFWLINTAIDIWVGFGYGAIIYCAAIANVNPNLHEAAAIDGAGEWKRMWHISIPSIIPLVVTMLTLRIGTVFLQGFDKVLLLYSPSIYSTADCLTTYIYRIAFAGSADYGVSTAAGLFQSAIATTLLIISNYLNRKITKSSLF